MTCIFVKKKTAVFKNFPSILHDVAILHGIDFKVNYSVNFSSLSVTFSQAVSFSLVIAKSGKCLRFLKKEKCRSREIVD